jgi:hypothetical protein
MPAAKSPSGVANRATTGHKRIEAASRAWADVLPTMVVPAFQALSQALAAEGHRFNVLTPGESARLAMERSAEEFIELALDTARDVPAVMLRSTRGRGRRMISSERVAVEGGAIAPLTQEAVLGFLLEELVPFIER